jgi:hypothetical protein
MMFHYNSFRYWRFSLWCLLGLWPFGSPNSVVWNVGTNISDGHAASIFWAENERSMCLFIEMRENVPVLLHLCVGR